MTLYVVLQRINLVLVLMFKQRWKKQMKAAKEKEEVILNWC